MNFGLLLLLGATVTLATHLLLRWTFYLRVLVAALFATAVIMVARLLSAEYVSALSPFDVFVWFCLQVPVAILLGLTTDWWRTRDQPRRPLHLRAIGKWTGTILGCWLAALWFYDFGLDGKVLFVRHFDKDGSGFWMLSLSAPSIGIDRIDIPNPTTSGTLQFETLPSRYGREMREFLGLSLPTIHWGRNWRWIQIPSWIPFMLIGLPTAFFWYVDRPRPKPGHCKKCGYDLTGNISGTCPECGTPCADEAAGA